MGPENTNARLLRVARLKEKSRVLGPGVRSVIWFHGCSKHCPGCIAKSMNDAADFQTFTPECLAETVCAIKGTSGVTLSGGEPFEQNPEALATFLAIVKKTNRNVMCFTGYQYENLSASAAWSPVLHQIDLLIDGEYMEAQNNGTIWRGSSNQRFFFLSESLMEYKGKIEQVSGRALEFDLNINQTIDITGIPPKGFLDRFKKSMNSNNYDIVW